jgi:uncharacterized repeat protein (TIGR01451 family)
MNQKPRVLDWAFPFLCLICLLFAAFALLPTWALAQERGYAAPDEPLGSGVGIAALPSTTGYTIDDGDDPGFSPLPPYPGLPTWAYSGVGGYQGDFIYTAADNNGHTAEWRPDLAPGTYEVQVHYWANSDPGTQRNDALYMVHYQGGLASQRVNQQRKADGSVAPGGANSGWHTLGRYPFAGDSTGRVTLNDNTTGWGTGSYVVADAVRFLPVHVWVDDHYCSACTNDGHLWGVTAFDNIPAGIMAVANGGTVHVGPGRYNQALRLAKSLTLSGAGAATTVITVSGGIDTAIEMLVSDVTIAGFTIEGSGVAYGIRNFSSSTASWSDDLTGYHITDNVLQGFEYGLRLRKARGEIRDNIVHHNATAGIWVHGYPSTSPGPTTIAGNELFANGGAGTDNDIRVQDSYAGTTVSDNTITGSAGANPNEACIQVLDEAGELTLFGNSVTNCTEGIRIWQVANSIGAQNVALRDNTVTGGAIGVHAGRDTATTWSARQLTVGGTLASANRIHGNGSAGGNDELKLTRYSSPVDARYNQWGVCLIRRIEEEIYNYYDDSALGVVNYDPALCVPYEVEIEAEKTSLPADGFSATTITATARDVAGQPVDPGTLIGITTSLGTVPFGYAEAEDTSQVVRTGSWATPGGFERASGGQVLASSDPVSKLGWDFAGQGVAVVYARDVGGGRAEVRIDGVLVKTLDMSGPQRELRVEELVRTGLGPGTHQLEIRPDGSGNIWVDAFRSGGVVATEGRIVTTLTSAAAVGDANVWATAYNGKIVTLTSVALDPVVTDDTYVAFRSADVSISKGAAPTSLNSGQEVTYTITYGNSGPETATRTVVTDTLPTDFLYVRSSSTPNREPPTTVFGEKYVWDIGSLAPGQSGSITLVARPDPGVSWTTPVVATNVAEITSGPPDPVTGNNSSGPVIVTVVVPTDISITADPPAIRVSTGDRTTELRVTVRDSNSNLVDGAQVALSTTEGTFPASGGGTLVVTTEDGVALADLASIPTPTTATVTAAVLPSGVPSATLQVPFLPGLPDRIIADVDPRQIRLCGETSVVTATIEDRFGNLVEDGTEVQFTVVPGVRGYMDPEWVYTVNGVATSMLHSGQYLFGERHLIVRIAARRETQQAIREERVDLRPGLTDNIIITSLPPVLPVGGERAVIKATVQDCGGNSVEDGTDVTFAASGLGTIWPTMAQTTDGRAYATFESDCTIGDAVITATADLQSFSTILPLEAGPADHFGGLSVTPSNTIRNCGGEALITARVYDRCFNFVKDGTPVEFASAFDTVTVLPNPAFTQGGVVSATIKSLDKPLRAWPQSSEQVAFTSGSALPSFVDLWIVPGFASIVEVSAEPESIPINGDVNLYDIVVEVLVTDCSGTPVTDGTLVDVQTDLGLFRESGTWSWTAGTVGGLITATLTSGQEAGIVTVTATADSVAGSTTVLFEPDEPYHVEVWGHPFDLPADGRSTSRITAWVQDYYYNPVLAGITVTFITEHGLFLESGDDYYTTTTTTGGYAFGTLLSSRTHIGTVNIYAVTYNSRTGIGIVQFVVPPEIRYIYLPIIRRNGL